jgi:hypothetical protein
MNTLAKDSKHFGCQSVGMWVISSTASADMDVSPVPPKASTASTLTLYKSAVDWA